MPNGTPWAVGGPGAVLAETSGAEGASANVITEGVVYRGGSFTDQNFTPRPGVDTTGLSTFDSLEAAAQPGGKAQIIDVSKLNNLKAVPDAPPPGHVSITPGDTALLEEWMGTRGTSIVHPLTEELKAARIGEIKRTK